MKISKKIINLFIFVYITFLFVYSFLVNVEKQSLHSMYFDHDQLRDTYVSYFINEHRQDPNYPPWCGNCRKEYHLRNSKLYYYLLAPFSFTSDGSSLLYFCSFWFSVSIPLVFILTFLISSNKYAGILAATIMFQGNFMDYVIQMPYQPLFTSTMSIIFLIFLILAKNKDSIWYFLFSTVALFLGIQFHLSFLPLIILYLWVFLVLFGKLKLNGKLFLCLILVSFLRFFLVFNTDFFSDDTYSPVFSSIQIASFGNFGKILLNGMINDYKNIFGSHFIFFYIFLLFLILNFKKIGNKFLFLSLIFYPLFAVGSHTDNIFTAPYIPIFVVLFSWVVLESKNRFLFISIFCLVIVFNFNKFLFYYVPFENPVHTSKEIFSAMNEEMDLVIKNNSNYCAYMCGGDAIFSNVAFYFYKTQIGESNKSYFDSICPEVFDINNLQENYLYSFNFGNDCKSVFKNFVDIYDFEKIFSKDGRTIYLITRK